MFIENFNEIDRQVWLKQILTALPQGARILDAGAGELKNRQYCGHLDYVSQDFCQYKGGRGSSDEGLQFQSWDTSRIDLVSDISAIPAPGDSLGSLERQLGNCAWTLAYTYALLGLLYFKLRSNKRSGDLACFVWQCVALK